MRHSGVLRPVTAVAWARFCNEARDCDCCGARGALLCLESPGHTDIHAFVCRACGKDPRC